MARKTNKRKFPKPPESLEGEALLAWERVWADLEAIKRADIADRALVEMYCRAWSRYLDADRVVSKIGVRETYANGQAGTPPEYKALLDAEKMCRNLLIDMGLTPTSRAKSSDAVTDDLVF